MPLVDTDMLVCCGETRSSHNIMLFSVVTAGNKEVLKKTDAVVISCKVTDITAALQAVKWVKYDGVTDITTGVTGYTSDEGSFAENSQTTTLTVASAQTSYRDRKYTCLITPALADDADATEISTTVSLDVFCEYLVV